MEGRAIFSNNGGHVGGGISGLARPTPLVAEEKGEGVIDVETEDSESDNGDDEPDTPPVFGMDQLSTEAGSLYTETIEEGEERDRTSSQGSSRGSFSGGGGVSFDGGAADGDNRVSEATKKRKEMFGVRRTLSSGAEKVAAFPAKMNQLANSGFKSFSMKKSSKSLDGRTGSMGSIGGRGGRGARRVSTKTQSVWHSYVAQSSQGSGPLMSRESGELPAAPDKDDREGAPPPPPSGGGV